MPAFAANRSGVVRQVLVDHVVGVVGQRPVPRGHGIVDDVDGDVDSPADAVLDAGVAAVAQFQIGQLAAGSTGGGVGELTGDPHAIVVGDTQRRAGSNA